MSLKNLEDRILQRIAEIEKDQPEPSQEEALRDILSQNSTVSTAPAAPVKDYGLVLDETIEDPFKQPEVYEPTDEEIREAQRDLTPDCGTEVVGLEGPVETIDPDRFEPRGSVEKDPDAFAIYSGFASAVEADHPQVVILEKAGHQLVQKNSNGAWQLQDPVSGFKYVQLVPTGGLPNFTDPYENQAHQGDLIVWAFSPDDKVAGYLHNGMVFTTVDTEES